MNISQQNGTVVDGKSGQEVAKNHLLGRFAKTDMRNWHGKIFQPSYAWKGERRLVEDWAARIQWRGRRELFNLKTANKAVAAAKAKEIYAVIVGAGWPEAIAKFKPEMERKNLSTVGDFVTELRRHWSGKPKTFEDYCRSFERMALSCFLSSTRPCRNRARCRG